MSLVPRKLDRIAFEECKLENKRKVVSHMQCVVEVKHIKVLRFEIYGACIVSLKAWRYGVVLLQKFLCIVFVRRYLKMLIFPPTDLKLIENQNQKCSVFHL